MDPHLFNQFGDLPQIPSIATEDNTFNSWPNSYYSHVSYSQTGGRGTTSSRAHLPFNELGPSAIQPIQRYLSNVDSSPYPPGLYQSNFEQTPPLPAQHLRPYELRPYPSSDFASYPGRHVSPGDRASDSGDSSQCLQNELHSPNPYHQTHYGSPIDAGVYNPGMSYPSPEHSADGACSPHLPPLGGGICPRDIEYEHPCTEQTVQEHEHEHEHEHEQDYPEIKSEHENVFIKASPTDADTDEEDWKNFDPAMTNTFQKEESVKPAAEESDSDYVPAPKPVKKRQLSSSSGSSRQVKRRTRKNSTTSSVHSPTKSTKRSRGANSPSSAKKNSQRCEVDAQRPFPCTLAGYGCPSTFVSKNEWKRHMSTQHIKVGMWRCDLCVTSVDPNDDNTVYYNDFNRKDLFGQHLRRMHSALPPVKDLGRNSIKYPVTEENISEHIDRCYRVLRTAPAQSSCLFCEVKFSGPASWEERMDHVGRHLEKERKPEMLNIASWRVDQGFESYLVNENLIAYDPTTGGWKIGKGKPRRDSQHDSDDDDDQNAL